MIYSVLPLNFIVQMYLDKVLRIPLKLPSVLGESGIKNLIVSFALLGGVTPWGDKVPRGFHFHGECNLIGFKAVVDVLFDPIGLYFKLEADFTSFNLVNFLIVARSKTDSSTGPHAFIELGVTPFKFLFDIQGYVKCFLFETYIKILITSTQLEFTLDCSFFFIFDAHLWVKATYASFRDMSLHFTADLSLKKIGPDIKKKIIEIGDIVLRSIDAAIKDVKDKEDDVNSKKCSLELESETEAMLEDYSRLSDALSGKVEGFDMHTLKGRTRVGQKTIFTGTDNSKASFRTLQEGMLVVEDESGSKFEFLGLLNKEKTGLLGTGMFVRNEENVIQQVTMVFEDDKEFKITKTLAQMKSQKQQEFEKVHLETSGQLNHLSMAINGIFICLKSNYSLGVSVELSESESAEIIEYMESMTSSKSGSSWSDGWDSNDENRRRREEADAPIKERQAAEMQRRVAEETARYNPFAASERAAQLVQETAQKNAGFRIVDDLGDVNRRYDFDFKPLTKTKDDIIMDRQAFDHELYIVQSGKYQAGAPISIESQKLFFDMAKLPRGKQLVSRNAKILDCAQTYFRYLFQTQQEFAPNSFDVVLAGVSWYKAVYAPAGKGVADMTRKNIQKDKETRDKEIRAENERIWKTREAEVF